MVDVNDLRVLVVPGGEGITYESSIDEILASPGLTTWRLGEYFQAQNDDRLPLDGWTSLINEKTKVNLTGCEML